MKLKYTQGNWQTDLNDRRDNKDCIHVHIGNKYAVENEICAIYGGTPPQEPETEIANALLISKAPKLLRAIILMADREGTEYLYSLVEDATGEKWSIHDMAEAALYIKQNYPNG